MVIIPQGKRTCSVDLIEKKGWQVTSKRKRGAQSILYLSMCSWHWDDMLYCNETSWWAGGCWKERRVWRMKVRQTTQNFFLLNFNLLDKNNSKWSSAYAWGRGGILSFFQETARLTELLIMSPIALSNSVSLIMAELSTPRHLRFHSCSPFWGLI